MRRSVLQRVGALVVAAACIGCSTADVPVPEPAPPPLSGTLEVDGVSAPVTVVRDRWGIPHITASTPGDLFFAQGFVQAQDRLFQMDLWRRSTQGRLSEVLGPNFVERDAMTRRMQYRGDPTVEWASYGPDAQAAAVAFTRGINAWIVRTREDLPGEFRLAGWKPELWRPDDLLSRTDAFLASGNAQDELFRAQLAAAVGLATAYELFPLEIGSAAPPRGIDPATISPAVGEILRRVGTPPFFSGFASPFEDANRSGSNAWAIARGPEGGPWLAVDPHRALQTPALRYLVHLRAPGWHVAGATSPWLPGVAVGHNEDLAWGTTAAFIDSQDIYVEELNPDNPRQVRAQGRWVDLVVRPDAIAVKGRAEPYEYEQLFTPRGVIIALDRERHRAYALRWSGAEPGGASELAALGLNRARSFEEFRAALERWMMPPVEVVYADVSGRIARQLAGAAPMRRGWDGGLPAPGDAPYTWAGQRTAPPVVGPPPDYLASANRNAPRLNRISEVLSERSSSGQTASLLLQRDVRAWRARRLVPLLRGVQSDRDEIESARQRLLAWDERVSADSREGALYVAWERSLVQRLAARRVPEQLALEYASRAEERLVAAIVRRSRVWFPAGAADRNRLLLDALASAVDEQQNGASGRQVTFSHPLALSDAARRRFAVGPFVMPGYAHTVLSVTGSPDRSVGPAFRAVFDAADWDRSVVMNAPGQSEHPGSPHFSDLASLWAKGEVVPLAFSDEAVQANAQATLLLLPPPRR